MQSHSFSGWNPKMGSKFDMMSGEELELKSLGKRRNRAVVKRGLLRKEAKNKSEIWAFIYW